MNTIGRDRAGTEVTAVSWREGDAETALRAATARSAGPPASPPIKAPRRQGRTSIEIVNRIIALENELILLRHELSTRADTQRG